MGNRSSVRASGAPVQEIESPIPDDPMARNQSIEVTPINILLVDDEPKNLVVLETILDDQRYKLIRAESADEALLLLVKEEFAVLVLDIHMPGMSGFELAQLIKQRKKNASLPIIFLTAYYSEDQHVLEGYETGAVDYLHKPINPTILRSKVAVFADLYLKTRELAAANRALVSEVDERRRVQQELLNLNNKLEQRVDERAAEFFNVNLALRDSEERLRIAQSVSGAGIWDWQSATGDTWWSDTMWEIYGITPVPSREILYAWRARLHPEDRADAEAQLFALLADGGGSMLQDEFRIIRPDGECHWVEFIVRVERDSSGKAIRILGVNADITKRKRLEDNLRQVADELSESDRRKDQFLAMLAHELRNPLAPIRNAVEILRAMPENAEAVKSSTTIMDRQVAQMVRLVDDLLDVSRISRGKIQLQMERIELGPTITEVVDAVRPFATQLQHTILTSLPSHPLHVDADATRLTQLVGNLLNNACKFTPPGGHISLAIEQLHDQAILSVTDSGIGIPADSLDRIFEMFVQGDTSLERSHSGLGIGLTLVKQLAEMHGGTVKAASAGTGAGSQFIVSLPLAKEAPTSLASAFFTTSRAAKPFGRILVVDDNRDAAESLAKLLELDGNVTTTAFDGHEALHAVDQFTPDIVLLDIGLPGLNGYEVARKIRQLPGGSKLVLVALTGWGKDEDRRQSREAGFDGHLVKPVEFAKLNSLLASLTSREA